MKRINILLLLFCLVTVSFAQEKAEIPYLIVNNDEQKIIPLESISVNTQISGVMADVTINQKFVNNSNSPIEAIYVFPASTNAAIYFMEMTIDKRIIIAKIQDSELARKQYNQAKEDGKTASLLEQKRPNVFQMNVANILPDDVINVKLKYTEILKPKESVYEFVFPTVVGPRYSNSKSDISNEQWLKNPYLEEKKDPMNTFHLSMDINTNIPIKSANCPSHNIEINYTSKSQAKLELSNSDVKKGNKDFILQFQLKGSQIETGFLCYEENGEKFLMSMIQPPARILPEIKVPREYIFILDVSGSMNGYPMNISKKIIKELVNDLKSYDKFNILFFAGGSSVLFPKPVSPTNENISQAISFIDQQSGSGGTELLPALKKAFDIEKTPSSSQSFVILTDGYISVEAEAFDLIRNNLGEANFFTFGIGTSINRFLLEGMAHVGMGNSYVITESGQAEKSAQEFMDYIRNPVLTDINIKFQNIEIFDVLPKNIPDLFALKPIVITGKYKGKASGNIIIDGKQGSKSFHQQIEISLSSKSKNNEAIKYYWVREKVKLLDDYNLLSTNDERTNTVKQLGLKYNIMTKYTSFIAIDSEIRNNTGNVNTVSQPLTLPEGVSNYATPRYGAYKTIKKEKHVSQTLFLEEEMYISDSDQDEFLIIEKQAEFIGAKSLEIFISKTIKMPITKEKTINKVVFVQFEIDEKGHIKNIKVVRGVSAEFDKEAIRVIKETKNMWKPAESQGKPIMSVMIIPVRFVKK